MRKLLVYIAALCCAVSLLSGCSLQVLAPEDTIKAPGATGFYAGVQQALEKSVGSDITLKYPLVDGVRTAFCARDFDGCGEKEILAFYQKKTEGAITRINVLTQEDGKWTSIQDVDPLGNELLQLSFADLDGDGLDEIIAGWQVYTSKSNRLCLYKMENKSLVQRAGETYSSFAVCDIDGNGQKEIAVALLEAESKKSSISFYNFTNDQFTLLSHLVLDGNVSSYSNMTVSNVGASEGIYLDAYKSSETMITELIYMNDGALYNPFADPTTGENQKTMRPLSLQSRDVNNDGYIEIPIAGTLPGYEGGENADRQYLIDWSYFDGKNYYNAFSAWYCRDGGYYLIFDENWRGKVTVIYDSEESTAVFCEWNARAGHIGNEIVRLTAFKSEEFSENPPDGYVEIERSTDRVFAAKLGADAGNLQVSAERLRESFKFMTE